MQKKKKWSLLKKRKKMECPVLRNGRAQLVGWGKKNLGKNEIQW